MGQPVQLSSDVAAAISGRLAMLNALVLPGQMLRGGVEPPSEERRREYLSALLLRDAGVFLERHSALLLAEELAAFEALRSDDYEVDFWLRREEAARSAAASAAAGPSAHPSPGAKNRRLAALQRLLAEGEFFAEESMRRRAPWLHEEYIGQYTTPEEAELEAAAAANREAALTGGCGLASAILQREAAADVRRQRQQERFDEVEEESESEEEEEEERGSGAAAAGPAATAAPPGAGPGQGRGPPASREERAESAAAFLDLMKQRFLAGEDAPEVDYGAIDADASLDDDWAAVAARDAEDAYFDEEEDAGEAEEEEEEEGVAGAEPMALGSGPPPGAPG